MPLRDYEDEVLTPEKVRAERHRAIFRGVFRLAATLAILGAAAWAYATFAA